MALSLDTTVGGSAANSYASLAEASIYFEAIPHFTETWELMSSQQKVARLIEAARTIDRMNVLGDKVDLDQKMAFPRTTQVRNDWSVIPPEVKDAQCEAVIALHRHRDATAGTAERPVSELNVPGSIAIKYADDGGQAERERLGGGEWDTVRDLLRGYVASSSVGRIVK